MNDIEAERELEEAEAHASFERRMGVPERMVQESLREHHISALAMRDGELWKAEARAETLEGERDEAIRAQGNAENDQASAEASLRDAEARRLDLLDQKIELETDNAAMRTRIDELEAENFALRQTAEAAPVKPARKRTAKAKVTT